MDISTSTFTESNS